MVPENESVTLSISCHPCQLRTFKLARSDSHTGRRIISKTHAQSGLQRDGGYGSSFINPHVVQIAVPICCARYWTTCMPTGAACAASALCSGVLSREFSALKGGSVLYCSRRNSGGAMAALSPAWDVGTEMPACPRHIPSLTTHRALTTCSRRHTSRGAS